MSLVHTLYQWIDLLWIPIALLTMERGKKIFTCGYILSCILLLRLQVEMMEKIGYPRGLLGWMESPVFMRGLIAYSGFIALFLVLAYFSPGANKHIHIAASITMLIAAFCVSAIIMVL